MTDPSLHPLEMILRHCAQAAPGPWYPSSFARAAGVPRDSLDPYLDQLRLGGLIRLTDWVRESGQGYVLTAEGRRVLEDPQELARLRSGKLTLRTEPEPVQRTDQEDSLTTWERGEAVREALFTPINPIMVRLLIGATVFWFGTGLFLGMQQGVAGETYLNPRLLPADTPEAPARVRELEAYAKLLDQLGALSGYDLVRGQWWRLVSYAFVHRGLLHILMNMYALFVLGRFAEQMWGRGRFLVLYLVTAVGGGTLALLVNPMAGLVGASGSVCGILAGTGIWVLLNRQHLPPQAVAAWMRNLIINVVLITLLSLMPGVSAAGHLGGAALGVVVGGLLNTHRFGTLAQRWLAAGSIVAVTGLCVGFLAWTVAHDRKWQLLRGDAVGVASTDDLYQQHLPNAQRADEEAETLYRKAVFPLLVQAPAERDAAKVEGAVAELKQVSGRLYGAVKELREQAGPYRDPRAERIRTDRATHLWHKAQLMELLIHRLQKGPAWGGADRLELENKRTLVRTLDWVWRRHLKRPAPEDAAPLPEEGHAPGRAIDPHPLPGPKPARDPRNRGHGR